MPEEPLKHITTSSLNITRKITKYAMKLAKTNKKKMWDFTFINSPSFKCCSPLRDKSKPKNCIGKLFHTPYQAANTSSSYLYNTFPIRHTNTLEIIE